jgi:serine-type D-Ala-D-Ala carboxypeptidase (penicillin-binding protein 5/6)
MTLARALAVLLAGLALVAGGPAAAARAQSGDEQRPEVQSATALVVDAASGRALYSRAAGRRRPIASTTKLMTALVVLERAELSDVAVAADYDALPVESTIGLREGERMTVADLLRALLVASANDAAVTLAEHVSGSTEAFVAEMNRRAQALGLSDTSFANPIGLDAEGNHSTARDLVALTLELRKHEFFRKVVDRPSLTLRSGARNRDIENRNTLVVEHPFVDGVKTGRTQQAGYVLVGSARRGGISLISVVMGAPSEPARNADTLALLDYGFDQYRRRTPVSRGQIVARVPIRYRPGATVGLMSGRDVVRRLRRGVGTRVEVVGIPEEVEGPVRRGQRLGSAEVYAGRQRIARIPLFAAGDVPAAGVARRTQDWFTRPGTLIALAVGVSLVTLASLLLRRRATPTRSSRREAEAT